MQLPFRLAGQMFLHENFRLVLSHLVFQSTTFRMTRPVEMVLIFESTTQKTIASKLVGPLRTANMVHLKQNFGFPSHQPQSSYLTLRSSQRRNISLAGIVCGIASMWLCHLQLGLIGLMVKRVGFGWLFLA